MFNFVNQLNNINSVFGYWKTQGVCFDSKQMLRCVCNGQKKLCTAETPCLSNDKLNTKKWVNNILLFYIFFFRLYFSFWEKKKEINLLFLSLSLSSAHTCLWFSLSFSILIFSLLYSIAFFLTKKKNIFRYV